MKLKVFGLCLVLVVAVLCAAPAVAQEIWYPNQNQVFIYIDVPAPASPAVPPGFNFVQPHGAWVPRAGFAIHGWAFNCNGSTPVLTLLRWDETTNQMQPWPATITTNIPRPDVQAAYSGWCTVTPNAGWVLTPSVPLPRGVEYLFVHGYAPGGAFNPVTGQFAPASRYDQRVVVFVQ